MSPQQGGAVLGITIMLLVLATLMLHGMQRQLDASLSLVADEQQYVQDFQQAQSALNWGLRQKWTLATGWSCQIEGQYRWRACLLRRDDNKGIVFGEPLLQGASSPDAKLEPLRLWHWVTFYGDGLKPLPGGWIDFCPLSPSQLCVIHEKQTDGL